MALEPRCGAPLALAALAVALPAAGQTWVRDLGGPSGGGSGVAVRVTPDGGVAALGTTSPEGRTDPDLLLVKLTAAGGVEWVRTYGGPEAERAYGLAVLADGYVLAAQSGSFDPVSPSGDGWMLRVDLQGEPLWQVALPVRPINEAHPLTVLADGGLTFVGALADTDRGTGLAAMVVELDGSARWVREYATGRSSVGSGVAALPDGFLVVGQGGVSSTDGNSMGFLLELDPLGGVRRALLLDGPGLTGFADEIHAVEPAPDGGVTLLGESRLTRDDQQWWLARLDADWSTRWERRLGSPGLDQTKHLASLPAGGVLAIGDAAWGGVVPDSWLVACDDFGTVAWQHRFPDAAWATSVVAAPGGGFYLAGSGSLPPSLRSRMLVARLDAAGTAPESCLQARATNAPVEEQSSVRIVPDVAVTSWPAEVTPTEGAAGTVPLVSDCVACADLLCGRIVVVDGPACSDGPIELALADAEGVEPLSVRWDVDGDGQIDLTGSTVTVDLEPGEHLVSAFVTDACPLAADCRADALVEVLPGADRLGEVSSVRSGEPPLLLLEEGSAVIVEAEAAATAFNVNVDGIGSWWAPAPDRGTTCALVEWTDRGDGTVRLDVDLPVGAWVDVTASNPCGEGPSGRSSLGAVRSDASTWVACGPAP